MPLNAEYVTSWVEAEWPRHVWVYATAPGRAELNEQVFVWFVSFLEFEWALDQHATWVSGPGGLEVCLLPRELVDDDEEVADG